MRPILFAMMLAVGSAGLSLPALASEPIVGPLSVKRTETGGIVVSGTAKELPPGTKVWVEITRQAGRAIKGGGPQSEVVTSQDGSFQSAAFTRNSPWPAGKYTVQVTSHFTSAWQTCDVIRQLKIDTDSRCRTSLQTNPALRDAPDLVPADREFPKAARYLEARREVVFPPLSEDSAVIDAVKSARLTVTGKGRSADPIGTVVAWFEKAPGFRAFGWSAKRASASGPWIVTLDCEDGEERKQAQWEYDPKTKAVRYLDPLAKTLSWLPRE